MFYMFLYLKIIIAVIKRCRDVLDCNNCLFEVRTNKMLQMGT
jgi:hypothetical protein